MTPKPIGALIPHVLSQTAKQHQGIHRIQRRWNRLVGREVAAHTRPVSLRRGRLYVQTDEPGASFAISLEKPRLLKLLQTTAGCKIEEVIVRPGEP